MRQLAYEEQIKAAFHETVQMVPDTTSTLFSSLFKQKHEEVFLRWGMIPRDTVEWDEHKVRLLYWPDYQLEAESLEFPIPKEAT